MGLRADLLPLPQAEICQNTVKNLCFSEFFRCFSEFSGLFSYNLKKDQICMEWPFLAK